MATQDARYINPLTDFGFKKIFGDEDIMSDFLNDIIAPKNPIVSVTFLDKEMKPETKFEHGVVYDMRCRLSTGEEVIVEMQNRSQDFFKDRICFYMAHAIASQGDRDGEEWKFQIHSVYGVFFMNFYLNETSSENTTQNLRHIALADLDTHDLFSDKLQLWLIELPRYRKMMESDCKTNRDYWLYILTHLETMNTAVPFQAEKPIFRKLESIADVAMLTRDERIHYNISLNSFRTSLAVMEHERNVGIKSGHAMGLAEGLEKGRAEGRAEGLKIGTLATARNLKSLGIPVETIAKATGLTIDEINNL